MTPREIAQALAADTESVCRMLLPNGKRVGHEWEAGSTDGEAGKSLKIHIDGLKAGVWKDFAGDEGGDLLDLWAKCNGVSLKEAVRQAKAHLGISDSRIENRRSYRKPERPQCVKPVGSVERYLAGRGLTPETIAGFRVAGTPDDTEIVFPFLRDGELVNVKYLKLERASGKKQMRVERDCEQCLFGWQTISDKARVISICEGEIDAMTLAQYGIPALSVFSGAGNHAWIENEYDRLERFDEIYICLDNDEPGQKGARELVERLGRERCRIVKLPYKDANECLKNGVPRETIKQCFMQAQTLDPVELRQAYDYAAEVRDEFANAYGNEPGFDLPWQKASGLIRCRFSEVILLAGQNGHGKSEAAGQITLDAIRQGAKACVASMELKPRKWLKRMTRQAAGARVPSEPYQAEIMSWYRDRLWVFDVVGTTKIDRVLEVFAYARKRYGINLFVIDNLAKCGVAEDNYNAQKDFVDRLTDFAKQHDVVVILVAHMRKRENEYGAANKMDVKGSGALTDMVDTVVIWWRNKAKEKVLNDHSTVAKEIDPQELEKPDAGMFCEKQRNGEHEPRIGLWFDADSHQYVERRGLRPRRYVNFMAKEVDGITEEERALHRARPERHV